MNVPPSITGYTVHQLLGQGGMAEVYLATQDSLQRKVAIKILSPSADSSFHQRFIAEAHCIASLNHPNIISIYDINQLDDGRYYLVMEFVAGGDLSQHKGEVFEATRALKLIKQIAQGLAVVHQQHLIHRDIKPANILFKNNEHIVITDFGIAKNINHNQELTQHGVVVGSPSYSSPEQAQCQPLDARTDIYSLGVILLEMLLGYNPYKADSYTQTVINHVQMAIPTLPKALQMYQPLLNKMLAKQPDQRFAHCQAVVAAIDELQPSVLTTKTTTRFLWPKLSIKQLVSSVSVIVVIFASVISFPIIKKQWQISDYLQQAEQRLQQQKLMSPQQDNADYFYRQVLLLNPQHPQAQQGLQRVLQARIKQQLQFAEQRFAEDKLSSPTNDNAMYYFQQTLNLEAGNTLAVAGLQRIANVYQGLAEQAYQDKKTTQALQYINLGLSANPQHPALLAMQQQHNSRINAATSPKNNTKVSSKTKAKKSSSSKKSDSLWHKLWGN